MQSPSHPARRWTRRSLVLASLAALALAAAGCTAGQAPVGLYLSEPAGAAPRWLAAPAGNPVWSPRGDQVIWGTEHGLLLSSLDGAMPTAMWPGSVSGAPAWSPDGRAIAFIDRVRAELVVLDAGAEQIQFSAPIDISSAGSPSLGTVTMGGPAWSPDGKQIAFDCWDGAGDEACIVRSDGTRRRQITQIRPLRASVDGRAGANTGPPAWSPDGAFVAVASYAERAGSPAGVFVVDLQESAARRISSLMAASQIRWYGDGNSVAFAVRRRGRSDVVRVSLSGGNIEELTAELRGSSWDPALRPGNAELAVATSDGVVILGRNPLRLIAVPAGLRAASPAWSPDGSALAFVAWPDPIAVYNQ